jgi:hypothetical protein
MSQGKVELLAALDAAIRILAARLLSMICLGMTFGLFAWAMYVQSNTSCVIAGGFALLVFLPVLIRDTGKLEEGPSDV